MSGLTYFPNGAGPPTVPTEPEPPVRARIRVNPGFRSCKNFLNVQNFLKIHVASNPWQSGKDKSPACERFLRFPETHLRVPPSPPSRVGGPSASSIVFSAVMSSTIITTPARFFWSSSSLTRTRAAVGVATRGGGSLHQERKRKQTFDGSGVQFTGAAN